MASVTQRIKEIKQPRGGYLKPSVFTTTILNDDDAILLCNKVSPITVGLVVDYMTRVILEQRKCNEFDIRRIFRISLEGAHLIDEQRFNYAFELMDVIELDSTSVAAVKACCNLVTFDSKYRSGIWFPEYIVEVSDEDAKIIQKLIYRSVTFLDEYGPIIESGMTFEGGYTKLVSSGDADFVTEDTLWDFKASKNKMLNRYTLQLYMYYLMGLNSIHSNLYKSVQYIGFYNPIRNEVIRLDVKRIDEDIKDAILFDVIGYER